VNRIVSSGVIALVLIVLSGSPPSESAASAPPGPYLGFDRNDYPGDENLSALRRAFSFSGYWLNNPPGANTNSWTGKREVIQAAGFGFLVVFNGRTYAQIKSAAQIESAGDPARLGKSDGSLAVAAAEREGFPTATIIYLDQEEGGRLLPEQRAYLFAWVDAVEVAGFRAGIYCSGIAAREGSGASVITAQDIAQNAGGRKLTYWVSNDSCPPSPGCAFPTKPPPPARSGVPFADVWQFAQSPRRRDFARGCASTYSNDGNCYPPAAAPHLHVDLDAATSADPSQGRTHAAGGLRRYSAHIDPPPGWHRDRRSRSATK
jgi:hypothetical protein